MLDSITRFFDIYIAAGAVEPERDNDNALQLATAALLVEIMYVDQKVTDEEEQTVIRAITDGFPISQEEAQTLIELAKEEVEYATDYYQFTSLINKSLDPASKVYIIEQLWKVAFADNQLDCYEEHLIRKIADLLYVPHREFIAAKHRADTRSG